jgi:hypothetical protein
VDGAFDCATTPGPADHTLTIELPERCRVDDCERAAVVSVVRDDLPGPIRLCATHTEDFRMNGARWTVTWSLGATAPVSVRPAPSVPVGRSDDAASVPVLPGTPRRGWLRSRLSALRQPRL